MSIPRYSKTSLFYFRLAELVRDDNLVMSLEGITENDESYFTLDRKFDYERSLNRVFTSRLDISFGLDQEVTLVRRSVYNSF